MGRWTVTDVFGRALEPARALTVLAVVLGAAQVVEVAIVDDVGHRAVTLVFALLAPATLAFAWRAPLAALLAFDALVVADAALGGRTLSATETAVFICMAGMLVLGLRADARAFALGALATVALLTTASLLEGDSGSLLSGIAWVCIVPVGIPGLLGRVLRGRNDLNRRLDEQARELERNRAEREQAAVLAERTRIARELQEGLTNALKHGGRGQARVTLRWSPELLEVEVANRIAGAGAGLAGGGHGLVGMRERVALCGGELRAGPVGRGFVVRARLPRERGLSSRARAAA